MSIEDVVRQALADNAQGPRRPGPDIAGLVAGGERVRRRRAWAVAGSFGAVGALGLAVWVGTPDRVDGSPSPATSPTSSAEGWGPDAALLSVDGVPYGGVEQWRTVDRIDSFTVVEGGVVYVDPSTSQIVWEGWDRTTKVIGERPWHPDADASYGEMSGVAYGRHRGVVGNPLHDLVSWVESDGAARGDLVVVRASTGEELARAPIEAPSDRYVILASVDQEAVSFATPTTNDATGYILGDDVWVWRWAQGESPAVPPQRAGQRIMDVSGDIWAVDAGSLLRFEDGSGRLLSQVHASYEDRTYFGNPLSPDGRFWYGPAHGEVVATATGEVVGLDWTGHPFGWSGVTELTMIADWFGQATSTAGGPAPLLGSCDAITGACTDPVPIPDLGMCAADMPDCGYGLPTS